MKVMTSLCQVCNVIEYFGYMAKEEYTQTPNICITDQVCKSQTKRDATSFLNVPSVTPTEKVNKTHVEGEMAQKKNMHIDK